MLSGVKHEKKYNLGPWPSIFESVNVSGCVRVTTDIIDGQDGYIKGGNKQCFYDKFEVQ